MVLRKMVDQHPLFLEFGGHETLYSLSAKQLRRQYRRIEVDPMWWLIDKEWRVQLETRVMSMLGNNSLEGKTVLKIQVGQLRSPLDHFSSQQRSRTGGLSRRYLSRSMRHRRVRHPTQLLGSVPPRAGR